MTEAHIPTFRLSLTTTKPARHDAAMAVADLALKGPSHRLPAPETLEGVAELLKSARSHLDRMNPHDLAAYTVARNILTDLIGFVFDAAGTE